MKGLVWIIVIIIIVAGIFYFMSGDEATAPSDEMMSDEAMTDDNSVMTEDENSTDENSAMEDDNQMMDSEADVSVRIEGSSFKFAPNMIEANVGDTVEVEFVNVGGFHDFVIDKFDAKTSQISEGETETISFVVDEAGEFEFYCSVGNHRAQGMVGTLIVN